MQVILLDHVHGLGGLGDTVNVKSGYARNYLIPKAKALTATPANLAEFEARRAELERKQADAVAAAKARASQIDGSAVTITCKAGEEGKLFGSVGARDIADALVAAGHAVERQEVNLPDGSLRQLGEYPVTVQLHADVEAAVTVTIVAEG